MTLKKRNLATLMICTAATTIVATSCKQPASRESAGADTAVATPPGAPASAPAPGELAENIYDLSKASDWGTATAKLDTLRTVVEASVATSTVRVDKAQIARLGQAVSARERATAMEAANALTRDFAPASAAAARVPVEIVLLDYLGRELEIGAARGDAGLSRIRSTVTDIRQTWSAVRANVVSRGGSAEAEAFDRVVSRLGTARSPADYGAVATPILDEVDRLEAVFNR